MADQTIDAIKVRLGVNTDDIAAGVRTANEQLDKIGSKTRVVRVRVEAVRANTGAQSLHLYMAKARKDAKSGIEVPISVRANETGEFGIGKLRTKIARALAVGGGVNVPIKIALSASDKSRLKKEISEAISPVTIYFDWVARNKPGHPPGTTNISTDPGPGGRGGDTGTGPSTGRGARPGESRAQRSARNKAEHAAAQAQAKADRAAQQTADTQQKAALKELEELKKTRDQLVAGMGTGSAPKPPKAPRTATGAPATGVASTAGVAGGVGSRAPHKGTPLTGQRFNKNYRTSSAPRGFGADYAYASGTDAEMIRGIQGVQELQAQGVRAEDMAAFVTKMKAAGVNPADPEETTGFLRSMKGSSRRRLFGRLGPAGAEGDPLDDPQVLSAFLGRLQTIGEGYEEQVYQTKGGIANRKAGARKGGNAGGGGGPTQGIRNRADRRPRKTAREKLIEAQLAAAGPPPPRAAPKGRSFRPDMSEELSDAEKSELVRQTRAQPRSTGPTPISGYPEPPSAKFDPFKILFSGVPGPATAATYAGALAQRYSRMKGISGIEAGREVSTFLGGRKLPYRMYPEGYAEGGQVKHTGLLGRMAAAGHQPSLTLLGERGPELAVTDEKGESEVVPTHQVPTWLARAREGRGVAKDLTRRADGGGFTFRGRTGFTSKPSNIVSAGGMIQRVFVVNWPAAMQAAAGGMSQQAAAGPLHAAAQALNRAAANLGGRGAPAGGGAAGGGAGGGGAAAGGMAGGVGGATPAFGPGLGRQRSGASLARGRFNQRQLELSDIQSQISEAQSLTPVRALSVSFGQIASQLSGRAEMQARARRAARLTTQAESALRAEAGERSKLAEMMLTERRYRRNLASLNKKETEELAKLPDAIRDQRVRVERANKTAVARQGTATEAAGNIVTAGSALKNIAASAVGISVGTLAFSAAYGALNTGVEAFVDVVSKAIERASGFQNVAGKVTSTLADQTREMGGASRATVALAAAQTGLSDAEYKSIGPTIERRTQVEAGNKAISDALDLLHTYEAVTQQNKAQPGGERGLSRTTGGLFGSIVNGTASTAELLGNEFAGVPAAGAPDAGALGLFPNEAEQMRRAQQIVDQRAAVEDRTFTQKYGNKAIPPTESMAISAKETLQKLGQGDMGQGRIDFFNEALKKGGDGLLKFSRQTETTTDAIRDAQAQAADAGGAFGVAQAIRDRRVIIADAAGNPITMPTAEQFTHLLEDVNAGFQTQDPNLLLKKLQSQPGQVGPIEAAIRGIRREGGYERNALLPAATAMRFAAQPLVPYNDPRRFPNAGVGSIPLGSGAEDYKKAFAAYADVALPAQKAITAEIDKGRKALMDMGVPPKLIDDIGVIGKQIQNIQLGVQQRGLNLQVAEYNNELRIANRSLKDAKDFMAGIHGAAGDTLGALEGQNVALSRQLQLLQFELSQRQINFKVASAGFVAPGTTPEERAARIEEAKIEASFAQKQLDIQKQIASNEFKGTGIGAQRNITDLQAQIGLLTQGRAITIDTAAAQAAVEALQEQQNILIDKAQSYQAQSTKIASLYMSTWTEIETQSHKTLNELGTGLSDAFSSAGAAFIASINAATNPANYVPGNTGPNGAPATPGGTHHATGYTGYHATPTQMTVGDAGGEEVAVLRNPRRMLMQVGGNGGGGFNMGGLTVIVQGGGNGGNDDADALAAKIARKVEDTLMRKTSLFGLRR